MTGPGRSRRFVDIRSPSSRLAGVRRMVDIGCAADRNTAQSALPDMAPATGPISTHTTQSSQPFPKGVRPNADIQRFNNRPNADFQSIAG